MSIVAYRYKFSDWEARVMEFKPEWHYTGHNCKGDLPPDATIEPMYSQAYVQELEQRCERLQGEANTSEKWKGLYEAVAGKL